MSVIVAARLRVNAFVNACERAQRDVGVADIDFAPLRKNCYRALIENNAFGKIPLTPISARACEALRIPFSQEAILAYLSGGAIV
jgi:hypothetical protein